MTDYNKALLKAAYKGNLEMVKNALQNDAFINYYNTDKDFYYCTALKLAAINGHIKIVKYLVENGANPFVPLEKELPRDLLALMERNKRIDVADYLLQVMTSPKIINRINQCGHTVLTYCLHYGYLEKAKQLIDLGADVCKMDDFRKRPLVYAVEGNSLEMVMILLEKGAGVSGVSALESALDRSFYEIAQCIIESKTALLVDANFQDGSTPLTKSIKKRNLKMVKLLLENGSDPEKKDSKGNSPFWMALEDHSIEIAQILSSETDTVPVELSKRLLHKFAEDGRVEVYKFLLKHNWDIEQSDPEGNTSLALSAKHEHLMLTEFLIENGGDIEKAEGEIEHFRKKDIDFDNFIRVYFSKNALHSWCLIEKGQE